MTMAGNWLASLGQALLRPKTFQTLVSPAIADLQCEASHGVVARARHYAAIAAVFACALGRDFRFDLGPAFDANARRHVWSWTALWTVGFAALVGWITFREDLSLLGPAATPAILTTALLKSLVAAFSVAMTAATFYLLRKGATIRTVIATTLVLFVAALSTLFGIHPLRMSADRELYDIGHALNAKAPSLTSLLAVWLNFQAADIDSTFARGRDLRDALGVVNGMLLGMVLASSRRWRVPLTAIMLLAAMAATFAVAMVVMPFGMPGYPPSHAFQGWRNVAISFVVPAVWILATARRRRMRQAD